MAKKRRCNMTPEELERARERDRELKKQIRAAEKELEKRFRKEREEEYDRWWRRMNLEGEEECKQHIDNWENNEQEATTSIRLHDNYKEQHTQINSCSKSMTASAEGDANQFLLEPVATVLSPTTILPNMTPAAATAAECAAATAAECAAASNAAECAAAFSAAEFAVASNASFKAYHAAMFRAQQQQHCFFLLPPTANDAAVSAVSTASVTATQPFDDTIQTADAAPSSAVATATDRFPLSTTTTKKYTITTAQSHIQPKRIYDMTREEFLLQQELKRQKDRDRMRRWRAALGQEQLELKRKRTAECMKRKRASENEEERRERDRDRMRRRRATLNEEQRELERKRNTECMKRRRASMNEEQKRIEKEKSRERMRRRSLKNAPEYLELVDDCKVVTPEKPLSEDSAATAVDV